MGGSGGGVRGVEIVNSKGCSRLFVDIASSFASSSFRMRDLKSQESMSPALSCSSSLVSQPLPVRPFSGLVICVTGLSKEARKQVKEATERLGGRYSPHLHPQCTHLVVQSFCGRKFEHALKHGSRNGLFVVTLGWLVDSVRRNVRLSESLYNVKSIGESGRSMYDSNRIVQCPSLEDSSISVGMDGQAKEPDMIVGHGLCYSENGRRESTGTLLSGRKVFVDANVSTELQSKVVQAAVEEGATLVDQWFVGCNVSHVVCEGHSIQKYFGHSNYLVTPLWILKTSKEKCFQRLVQISADLARQVGSMLDHIDNGVNGEGGPEENPQGALQSRITSNHEERLKTVNLAKHGVRKRRACLMQTCETPIRPLTPCNLLDSICWSISEPTSFACIYTYSSGVEDAGGYHMPVSFDSKRDEKELEASFVNFSRPLTESEKHEIIFRNHFLTILFPVDRFAEMGPCAKTFFSGTGFTCLQVLDFVYAFYQENMSVQEIELAIHTDSRHADRLRSLYSSKEAEVHNCMEFKRIDFLGSRKSFEMLKRVTGDNSSNVYELFIRA